VRTAYWLTERLRYRRPSNPVHPHDGMRRCFILLGSHSHAANVRYSGRDFRLTDVHGK